MHTPTTFSYDGHGLNGDDEYKTRVLTFNKGLIPRQREEVANRIMVAVNAHEAMRKALHSALFALQHDLTDLNSCAATGRNEPLGEQIKAALALADGERVGR